MQLSERLNTVASLIPKCKTLADVGTDHGYLPIYCLQNDICKRAIAMDINKMPLEKSRQNIEKYGMSEYAETRLSDGFEKLKYCEADCIVTAGMGGLLIADILKKGKHAFGENTALIFQPMIAVRELREYLYLNGYTVLKECVCREENKYYNIISAVFKNTEYNLEDIVLGHNLSAVGKCTLKDYYDYKIRVNTKILNGLKSAIVADYERIKICTQELELYNCARRELKNE